MNSAAISARRQICGRQLTLADARAGRLRKQLDAFQVVPEYRELEREASEITGQINDLNVENIVDQDLMRELQASLAAERCAG